MYARFISSRVTKNQMTKSPELVVFTECFNLKMKQANIVVSQKQIKLMWYSKKLILTDIT